MRYTYEKQYNQDRSFMWYGIIDNEDKICGRNCIAQSLIEEHAKLVVDALNFAE
jgi:hypothetical protein